MDEKKENQYKALCEAVERRAGRSLKESQDFDWLAGQIMDTVHQMVSANTLKRLWGYYENVHVVTRKSVLDMLAQYVGYRNYAVFLMSANSKDGSNISDFVKTHHLDTRKLGEGFMVCITWNPDRRVMVEHLGGGHFVVRDVENSKLSVGDTFDCHLMIEGETLFLSNVVHNGNPPMAYQAGKQGGIHFEVVID